MTEMNTYYEELTDKEMEEIYSPIVIKWIKKGCPTPSDFEK